MPLFDNLILERLVERHQKEETETEETEETEEETEEEERSRGLSETSNLLEMSDVPDSAEEMFLQHKQGMQESLKMLGELESKINYNLER